MKIKQNKRLLLLVLGLGILSTPNLSSKVPKLDVDYIVQEYKHIHKPTTITELKEALKEMPKDQKKEVAKKIKVKKEGIVLDGNLIPKTDSCNYRTLTVRLTVYWAKGGSTDYHSSKFKSSTGATLRQGESVAVDPKVIPYWKNALIPNVGLVKAVDTGTAVIEKRASNGKLPVIDVFFTHKKDAILFANRYPKVVTVAVLN